MTENEHRQFHMAMHKQARKKVAHITGHVLLIVVVISVSFGSVYYPAFIGVVNAICVGTGCYALYYAHREDNRETHKERSNDEM